MSQWACWSYLHEHGWLYHKINHHSMGDNSGKLCVHSSLQAVVSYNEENYLLIYPLEEPCVSGNSKACKFHYLFGKNPFLHKRQCQCKSDMKKYIKYITDSPQSSHVQKLPKHALYHIITRYPSKHPWTILCDLFIDNSSLVYHVKE